MTTERRATIQFSSVGLGQALDESGWMMSVVLVLNHVSSPVQTMELDHTTVVILKMWQSTVPVCLQVHVCLNLLLTMTLTTREAKQVLICIYKDSM